MAGSDVPLEERCHVSLGAFNLILQQNSWRCVKTAVLVFVSNTRKMKYVEWNKYWSVVFFVLTQNQLTKLAVMSVSNYIIMKSTHNDCIFLINGGKKLVWTWQYILFYFFFHIYPLYSYANEIAVLINGKFSRTVSKVLYTAMGIVDYWYDKTGLSIKPNKMAVVCFIRKRYLGSAGTSSFWQNITAVHKTQIPCKNVGQEIDKKCMAEEI